MKRAEKLKSRFNTTSFRLNFWYILILLATVLFIGIIVTASVSYQLYKNTEVEVRHIENLLILTAQKKHPNWERSINNVIYENHPNVYVHIETPEGRTIYSDGSESIMDKDQQLSKTSWFTSLFLNRGSALIYHHNVSYHHYTFKIYVKLATIHEFVESMIRVLFFGTLAGLVIGSFAIYNLSRRLSRPLVDVTRMIKNSTAENLEVTVPVPKGPQEVKDLALAFNHLMNRLREQIRREKNFVSDASHELRTPLAAIHGHVNLILRHGKAHPEIIEQSSRFINQESMRMQRLIDQLLMLARLDQSTVTVAPVNISIIAKSIAEDYLPVIDQKFTVDIEDGVIGMVNEDHIHEIIISILENSGKYAPKDGWIRLVVCRRENDCYVIIQNSGPKIPDDEKEKVFERFYRIDKSRHSQIGGSGLGLSIAKQLIQINKGAIRVDDLEPEGCQFTVKFPARLDG
ncbi:HAMP domain-containing protein [Sporolactobacillus sp. THM7-4]|nr:HAMP domain-containing protein [Sporolactobacillus sp. THM7-4]